MVQFPQRRFAHAQVCARAGLRTRMFAPRRIYARAGFTHAQDFARAGLRTRRFAHLLRRGINAQKEQWIEVVLP